MVFRFFGGLFSLVFQCIPMHMSLRLYVFLLLSLWVFCLFYSILGSLFLFYFISFHYSFWMPVVFHEKECRFVWVVKWVWAKRSSKTGNHNQNTTLWKKNPTFNYKRVVTTESGFVNDYFQSRSNCVTPQHYVQIKQLLWVHPIIHNHILLIIMFQIEKMDISFNFWNRLGLLFQLCKAGYSEKIASIYQKSISAGQI